MREGVGNHLTIPPAGCPCPNESLISTTPPKTSMTTNQYIRIQ
jgi:hypothetical protein